MVKASQILCLLLVGQAVPADGFSAASSGVQQLQMLTPKYFKGQFTFGRTWLPSQQRTSSVSFDKTQREMTSTSHLPELDDPAVIARLHFAARKHIKHQRFEQARLLYETAVELSKGQHGRTFLLWALLEQRCGDYDRARSVFRQALEYHPHSDQVAMAWGLLESKQGLPNRARLLLQRAATLNPSRNIPVKKWKRLQPIFQQEQHNTATPRWAQKSWETHLCSGWDEGWEERRQWVRAEVARLVQQQEAEEVRRVYTGHE